MRFYVNERRANPRNRSYKRSRRRRHPLSSSPPSPSAVDVGFWISYKYREWLKSRPLHSYTYQSAHDRPAGQSEALAKRALAASRRHKRFRAAVATIDDPWLKSPALREVNHVHGSGWYYCFLTRGSSKLQATSWKIISPNLLSSEPVISETRIFFLIKHLPEKECVIP